MDLLFFLIQFKCWSVLAEGSRFRSVSPCGVRVCVCVGGALARLRSLSLSLSLPLASHPPPFPPSFLPFFFFFLWSPPPPPLPPPFFFFFLWPFLPLAPQAALESGEQDLKRTGLLGLALAFGGLALQGSYLQEHWQGAMWGVFLLGYVGIIFEEV